LIFHDKRAKPDNSTTRVKNEIVTQPAETNQTIVEKQPTTKAHSLAPEKKNQTAVNQTKDSESVVEPIVNPSNPFAENPLMPNLYTFNSNPMSSISNNPLGDFQSIVNSFMNSQNPISMSGMQFPFAGVDQNGNPFVNDFFNPQDLIPTNNVAPKSLIPNLDLQPDDNPEELLNEMLNNVPNVPFPNVGF